MRQEIGSQQFKLTNCTDDFFDLPPRNIGVEHQRRVNQECDLLRASFFVRTEVFRRFQAMPSTEEIGDNSAMIETLTTTFFHPFWSRGAQSLIDSIIVPKNVGTTVEVIRGILKSRPLTPKDFLFESGVEQLNAAIITASSTQGASIRGRTVAILDNTTDWTEVINLIEPSNDQVLSSLTVIIDVGSENINSTAISAVAWKRAGWEVFDVSNGHNPGSIMDALNLQSGSGGPRVIFVHTCSGKSLPFEGELYRQQPLLSKDALASIIAEREGIEELSSEPLDRSIDRILA